MASFTEFLGLLKKDPVADAADTFNIQTMLNDNWDKVDAAVESKAIYAAVASMGADGGLKNAPIINVDGILGVTQEQAEAADSGSNTMTISFDLSELPDDARIGFLGGLGVTPGALTQWGSQTYPVFISLTTSIVVNGEVIDGTMLAQPEREVWPDRNAYAQYAFPGVLVKEEQFNLAAMLGRSLRPSDKIAVVIKTNWRQSVGYASYCFADTATMPNLYIRYLEV